MVKIWWLDFGYETIVRRHLSEIYFTTHHQSGQVPSVALPLFTLFTLVHSDLVANKHVVTAASWLLSWLSSWLLLFLLLLLNAFPVRKRTNGT